MSAINAISTALCVIAFTFFLIGIIGYATETGVLVDIYWIRIHMSNTDNIYFGTRNAYFDLSGAQGVQYYDGNGCGASYCDECEYYGNLAAGLLIIALVFTTVSLGLSAASISTVFAVSKPFGITNIVMAFVAFATSIIGTVSYMTRCFREVDNNFPEEAEWGPGSILSLIGMILMGIVFVLQVVDVSIRDTDSDRIHR